MVYATISFNSYTNVVVGVTGLQYGASSYDELMFKLYKWIDGTGWVIQGSKEYYGYEFGSDTSCEASPFTDMEPNVSYRPEVYVKYAGTWYPQDPSISADGYLLQNSPYYMDAPGIPIATLSNAVSTHNTLSFDYTNTAGAMWLSVFSDADQVWKWIDESEFWVPGMVTSISGGHHIVFNNLTPATEYSFRVYTIIGSYSSMAPEGSPSYVSYWTGDAPIDTTPPTTPTITSATANGNTAANLSWTASTDASTPITYEQRHRIFGAGTWGSWTNVGAVTSTIVTGLHPNVSHIFQVRAKDAAGNYSSTSPESGYVTLPQDPNHAVTNFRVANQTSNSITFAWDTPIDTSYLARYALYSVTQGNYVPGYIGVNAPSNGFTWSVTVSTVIGYTYYIVSKSDLDLSTAHSNSITINNPVPTITSVTGNVLGPTSFEATCAVSGSWNSITWEYRRTGDSSWIPVGSTNNPTNTKTFTALTPNTSYDVKCTAVGSGGSSAPDTSMQIQTDALPVEPPTNISLSQVDNTKTIRISFTKDPNATATYAIYSFDGSTYFTGGNSTGNSINITVASYSTWHVKLYSMNGGDQSGYSSVYDITITPNNGVTSRAKVYIGGQGWVAKPTKVYINEQWVEKPLKFWDGGIWK